MYACPPLCCSAAASGEILTPTPGGSPGLLTPAGEIDNSKAMGFLSGMLQSPTGDAALGAMEAQLGATAAGDDSPQSGRHSPLEHPMKAFASLGAFALEDSADPEDAMTAEPEVPRGAVEPQPSSEDSRQEYRPRLQRGVEGGRPDLPDMEHGAADGAAEASSSIWDPSMRFHDNDNLATTSSAMLRNLSAPSMSAVLASAQSPSPTKSAAADHASPQISFAPRRSPAVVSVTWMLDVSDCADEDVPSTVEASSSEHKDPVCHTLD